MRSAACAGAISSAIAAVLALLWACKTEMAVVDAAPLPSASVAVAESPASAKPSAAPAASVACGRDADCVAVHSPCCTFWPANVASRSQVKEAIQAAEGERCKDRLCTMPLVETRCERGVCRVHAVDPGPLGR